MKYILLTLQQISWENSKGDSGLTWAYSNRKSKPSNFFGDKSTGFKVKRFVPGTVAEASPSNEIVTVWLTTWDDDKKKYVNIPEEEVELYRTEYGDTCYVDEDDNLITIEEYEKKMLAGEDVADDSTSEQPFAD